ncbi:MAG: hypothetical protein IPM23_11175 [Candidatus Melainabacteria bacterium]|nr:hypothetical protein [Candidatus Melainabacteria bacterium]
MDTINKQLENLETFLQRNGTVSLDEGIDMAVRILCVLDYCHGRKMTHNNLTPSKIVISDGQPSLIDFSFPINGHKANNTSIKDFLELPEYQVSLDLARRNDTVSDVTAVCGLLLYCLTGHVPGPVKDSDGRMPHQRPDVRAALDRVAGYRSFLINQIFDKAFQWQQSERFQTAIDLMEALSALRNYSPANSIPPANLTELISGLRSNTQSQTVTPHEMRLQTAFNGLRTVFGEVVRNLEADFREMESGYRKERTKPVYTAFLKLNYRLERDSAVKMTFRMEIVGSEIVVSGAVETSDCGNVEELFRAEHHGFYDSSDLEAAVREFVAVNLARMLTGSAGI